MLDRKINEQLVCSLEKILVIFLWILGPTPTFDIEPFFLSINCQRRDYTISRCKKQSDTPKGPALLVLIQPLGLVILFLGDDVYFLSAVLELHFTRCDATLNGAYIETEVAAYAIIIDLRQSLLLIPVDCLVSTIIA